MSGTRRALAALTCLAVGAIIPACSDEAVAPVPPGELQPTWVEVTPEAVELWALGATAQLAAEVQDQNGNVMAGVSVTWSSGDTLVATVDAAGLVTASANGKAVITATAGAASDSATASVSQVVDSLVVLPAEGSVEVANTLRLAAEALDENGHPVAEPALFWSSSNPAAAAVDPTGLVTGLSEGTATITASSGQAEASAEITVHNPDRAALTALYNATDGPNWAHSANWLTDAPLSEWDGVQTSDKGRVVALSLRVNALSGALPPELGDLTHLQRLSLDWNPGLAGKVPAEIGRLAKLERLALHRTSLAGPLPQTFLNLEAMRYFSGPSGLCVPGRSAFVEWLARLDSPSELVPPFCNVPDRKVLSNFHELTGGKQWSRSEGWLDGPALEKWHGISADSLGRVTAMHLSSNGLSGILPGDIGALARLVSLRVDGNSLKGRLPQSLAGLDLLEELHYDGTELCVPTEEGFGAWLGGVNSHNGTGVQCAPLTDRDALAALHSATGGSGWRENANWLSDAPLGDWHGVEVDDQGKVVELRLPNNGLTGPVPPELGGLADLRRLYLYRNELTGPIPRELAGLASLEALALGDNDLSGPIPPELGGLVDLLSLGLHLNDLSGVIPPELGNLSDLQVLTLEGNNLTGPIPRELGSLANLTQLWLHWNDLSGSIPPELGSLTKLHTLFLYANSLTGAIPPELGGAAELRWLYLPYNDLTGPIPPELGQLARLSVLYLDGNDLSGPIPTQLGSLTALQILSVTGNRLSGPVPGSFEALAALRRLDLSHNAAMAGPLPGGLTAAEDMEELLTTGTDLCAPSNGDFQDWLLGLRKLRIPSCGEPPAAYLVQTVQSRAFPVPLVEGEKALLRVFPTASVETTRGIPPIRARFYVDGREIHVENILGKSAPIPTKVDESSLRSSAAAEIPGRFIRPGLDMVIEIDPDRTLDPALGVARRIPAEGRLSVDVRRMPDLDLTLIPFVWTEGEDSSIVELVGGMAADPGGHEMLDDVRTLLPVRDIAARAHAPVASESNNALELLYRTEAIRVMEGGTGFYKGMMAPPVTGAGGVAWRPGKSSFSQPYASILAHELGHNMSLGHAPCGGPSGLDRAFPDGDGLSGAWGYDFAKSELVPPSTPDFMSYCGPEWVSDYHFTNALRFRLSDHDMAGTIAVAAPAKSLLLWGGVYPDGQPFLHPAFVVDAPPALPDSTGDYTVTGRSADGRELFALSFTMPELASEEDLGSAFVFALPVRAGWADGLASITLSGPERSATLDADSDVPMAILRDPRSGQVRGFLRDVADPAAVRADAVTGAAPGTRLDVLYSRGLPDRAAWQR